ncbi:hypothetical protein ACFCV3_00980 [Kribbella sp. NPDC056345]|uniref:hypothetical protein n=1 Tax=Kribbella sp. NPDC056345 TaxID=3345789 RepID=UPI0035DEC60B
MNHRGDGDPLIEETVNLRTAEYNGVNVTREESQISEHLAHVVIEQLEVTQD